MPSKKGKKEDKKDVVKKQPQAGKIEKSSSKKDKGPQKGVEKVAKIVDKKATQSVSKDKKSGSKSVSKKDSKKDTKKDSKKKKEPTPSSSSDDESMDSVSSSGSSSGSGSSSSGSGSSSSGSGSEDVEVKTPATPAKAQATPDAEAGTDGITKIFIGNLKFTITDEDVHKFFADCGTITEIAWSEGDDGRFAGRGIITFSKPSEAAKAANKNGQMLLERPLRCNLDIPRAPRGSQGAGSFGEPSLTLVLKGLAYKATTDDVRRAFSSVSSDVDVRIPAKGGVAFVEFSDLETAKKGIELADGLSIAGRNVVPEYAKPRDGSAAPRTPREGGFQQRGAGGNASSGGFKTPKPDGGCTFFMGGLPPSVEESDVRNAFSGCNIANIRWVERDGVFKGVAFVEFADTNTADSAFQKAQGGVHIKGRDARLDWAADSNKKKF